MSEQQTTEYGEWVEEPDELPPRPRRRWITPLTATLVGVLLAACGFVAGVLVEKGQGGTASGGTAAAAGGFRRAAGAAGGAGGGLGQAAARAGATIGQVSSLQGRTLYVTTTDGSTVQVNVPAGESIARTTSVGVGAIHPGDTVVIQGARGSDGAIAATSVRATASDALGGLFGGGGEAGGSSGGGSSLNQLFNGR